MGFARFCSLLILLSVVGVSHQTEYPCEEEVYDNCDAGEVCRLVLVNCFTTPCPPQPQCVLNPPTDGRCKYGDPVLDMNMASLKCTDICPDETSCTKKGYCCWG